MCEDGCNNMKGLKNHNIDTGIWREYKLCITLQYDDFIGHVYVPYLTDKRNILGIDAVCFFDGETSYESDCGFKQWIDDNDNIHIEAMLTSENRHNDELLWVVKDDEDLYEFFDLIVGLNIVEEKESE